MQHNNHHILTLAIGAPYGDRRAVRHVPGVRDVRAAAVAQPALRQHRREDETRGARQRQGGTRTVSHWIVKRAFSKNVSLGCSGSSHHKHNKKACGLLHCIN